MVSVYVADPDVKRYKDITRSEHSNRECYVHVPLWTVRKMSGVIKLSCAGTFVTLGIKCLDMPISEYRRLDKSDEEWREAEATTEPFSNSFVDTNTKLAVICIT